MLPTFYERLGKAFFSQIYANELDKICAERGQLSDDGDKVVDKHSGYLIKLIEFDSSEGYDETGYKIVSRAVLEEDIGDVLTAMSLGQSKNLSSKRGSMIKNILLTLLIH